MTTCPTCGIQLDQGAGPCPRCAATPGEPPPVAGEAEGPAASPSFVAELRKKRRIVFGALLLIAGLQTLIAGLLVVALLAGASDFGPLENAAELIGAAVMVSVVAALFWGLAFWALKQPFPPAVIGLVVLLSVWTLDALVDPTSLTRGIFIKILLLLALIQAVQAGAAHRRLSRSGPTAPAA